MKRSGMPRRSTPLRRRSVKRQQRTRDGEHLVVRDQVLTRAGGRCEVRTVDCTMYATLVHHRLRESHGGPWTVENLVAACRNCHTDAPSAIHRNVAWSYSVGLLIRSTDGPPTERWSHPVS